MLWKRLRGCRRSGGMALLLLLSACATNIETRPPALNCADFIPREWEEGVPGAAFPDSEKPDWRAFSLEQTGQLAKANGRQADTISICKAVKAQQVRAEEALAPRKWWQLLTPWRD